MLGKMNSHRYQMSGHNQYQYRSKIRNMRFEILLVGVKKDYFLMKAEEVVDVAMVVTMVVVVREGAVVSRPHKNIMI